MVRLLIAPVLSQFVILVTILTTLGMNLKCIWKFSAKRPKCLRQWPFQTSELIITITISEKENTFETNISSGDNVWSKKSGNFPVFFFFSGYVVVAMVIVINSVIGGFSWVNLVWSVASTVRLQVSDYSQRSDYTVRLQLYRVISGI